MPTGTMAGGSSQSVTIVAAVTAASEALVETLLRMAEIGSPFAGLLPNEVELRDGCVRSRSAPERSERYATILARAGLGDVMCEAAAPPPAEMQTYSMHSYGAQFCEIRVHAITGETRVARWVGSFDTGRILNPRTAASQFRGGIVMGIGLALTEEMLFDERTGRIMNPSLAAYHVPVHADVPEIDVIWNDIPDPYSPLGLHGIGEIGITGVAGAVAKLSTTRPENAFARRRSRSTRCSSRIQLAKPNLSQKLEILTRTRAACTRIVVPGGTCSVKKLGLCLLPAGSHRRPG